MIKRTLFFGNPAYLSCRQEQLLVTFPNSDQAEKRLPIEDLGMIILEHPQVTVTHALLTKLSEYKVCLVTCNAQHLPEGILLPMQGHTEHTERLRLQLQASLPLKKNLWQQTVTAKIRNQQAHLKARGKSSPRLDYLAKEVSSGDVENHEAQAAAIYWQSLFEIPDFTRAQGGMPPNNLLNYGYAILRAVIARALVSSGFLPSLGIWHRNKYNAFCLADDIMEPYRPLVDRIVYELWEQEPDLIELSPTFKKELLGIPTMDVRMQGHKSPLMVAASRTSQSLYECFAGTSRKILYPDYGG